MEIQITVGHTNLLQIFIILRSEELDMQSYLTSVWTCPITAWSTMSAV